MNVNWGDLGIVFVGTLVGAGALVTLFAVGVLGLSRQAQARERGGSATVALSGSVVCFTLCVTIVLYGIYLIVAK
jgi:hypothetical protein